MADIIYAATLTRPADTTLYTIGDVIAPASGGALQELPLATTNAGGTCFLVGLQCTTSQKACQGQLRYHFYSGSGVSSGGKPADNAVFPLLIADRSLYLGYVDLPAFGTEDTSSTIAVSFDKGLSFLLTSDAAKSVWFQHELKNGAFTPDSSQTFVTTAWVVK